MPSALTGSTNILYLSMDWAAAVVGLFQTRRFSESKTVMLNKSSFVTVSVFIKVVLPSTILPLRWRRLTSPAVSNKFMDERVHRQGSGPRRDSDFVQRSNEYCKCHCCSRVHTVGSPFQIPPRRAEANPKGQRPGRSQGSKSCPSAFQSRHSISPSHGDKHDPHV